MTGVMMSGHYVCWYQRVKKKKRKRKVGSWRMLKCLWRLVWCVQFKEKPSTHSQRTHGMVILVHYVTLQMAKWVSSKSPKIHKSFREAWALYLPLKKESSMSISVKLMVLNRYIIYGLWSFVPRQVQICFPKCVNTCRETR